MDITVQKVSALSYLMANKITVISDFVNRQYDAKVLEYSSEIEDYWLKEKAVRGGSLTNGTILNLGLINKVGERLVLKCHAIEYKHLLAQRSGLELGITPLAVSGITYYQSDDQKVFLLAKRSDKVTQFPGMFELVPSGSIDVSVINSATSEVDFKGQLIKELEEEIGVDEDQVINSREFCLVRDEENVFDIGVEIEILKNTSFKINLEEYSELQEMNINLLNSKLEESKTLKTSSVLYNAWFKQHE